MKLQNLPDEILCQIFTISVDQDKTFAAPTWSTLSRSCKRFHKLLSSIPFIPFYLDEDEYRNRHEENSAWNSLLKFRPLSSSLQKVISEKELLVFLKELRRSNVDFNVPELHIHNLFDGMWFLLKCSSSIIQGVTKLIINIKSMRSELCISRNEIPIVKSLTNVNSVVIKNPVRLDDHSETSRFQILFYNLCEMQLKIFANDMFIENLKNNVYVHSIRNLLCHVDCIKNVKGYRVAELFVTNYRNLLFNELLENLNSNFNFVGSIILQSKQFENVEKPITLYNEWMKNLMPNQDFIEFEGIDPSISSYEVFNLSNFNHNLFQKVNVFTLNDCYIRFEDVPLRATFAKIVLSRCIVTVSTIDSILFHCRNLLHFELFDCVVFDTATKSRRLPSFTAKVKIPIGSTVPFSNFKSVKRDLSNLNIQLNLYKGSIGRLMNLLSRLNIKKLTKHVLQSGNAEKKNKDSVINVGMLGLFYVEEDEIIDENRNFNQKQSKRLKPGKKGFF
ncbi:hypothetical protein O9G_001002 [Rozella allomycis CSF55]|uniref:Uncharacterized protein n=1 Tax=Rozella allomycis (strain CSF55) TaxID=988480 RepID=A0A075AMZ3_ROZAC|nr:hypothetical protein O9G_001002 [Rozella allomycis CSF55]|eukprot:EPZ31091.1 hypothetical protein O9G_001002 [Rozella allomycis CSF55]